jgi:diphthamide synthase (EF-2-diphthine--ammonia ligase)
MQPLLPLWGSNRKIIVEQMIEAGQKAMIVSCDEQLGEHFLGKMLNKQTLADIENMGADICGENGEYHTIVLDCERFSSPVTIHLGECRLVTRNLSQHEPGYYWYIDVSLKN